MNVFKNKEKSILLLLRKIIKNIIKHKDFDIDPLVYLIFPKEKLIYLVISKAGCTSIKVNLGEKYGIKSFDMDGQDIHLHAAWLKNYRNINKEYNDYFKFTFVRNPFARIVSCYKDKVLPKRNTEFNYFHNYFLKIPPSFSFDDFVKIISKIPDFLADRHFKSQYYSIVKNNKYKMDFIGKLENISNDWQNLAIRFNLNIVMPQKNKSEQSYNYFDYYDLNTAALVYKRYRKDIEYFGYLDDYLELVTYLKSKKTYK